MDENAVTALIYEGILHKFLVFNLVKQNQLFTTANRYSKSRRFTLEQLFGIVCMLSFIVKK